ncbi:MAG: hypothetical protein ACK55I_46085, partial [bacterium]
MIAAAFGSSGRLYDLSPMKSGHPVCPSDARRAVERGPRPMPHIISADSLAARVGDDLGASDWVLV